MIHLYIWETKEKKDHKNLVMPLLLKHVGASKDLLLFYKLLPVVITSLL